MNNKKRIAYAVDVETGRVIWVLYERSSWQCLTQEKS